MSYPFKSFTDRWQVIKAAIDSEAAIAVRCKAEMEDATYNTIQTAMPHIRYWMGEGLSEFVQEAIQRQVNVTALRDQSMNKYLIAVRCIWGQFDQEAQMVIDPPLGDGETKVPKWVPNRSAEKYASVIRFIIEEGVKDNDVAKFIREYKSDEHGNKLTGIVRADTARRGKKRALIKTVTVPCPGFAVQVQDGDEVFIRAKKVGGRLELRRLVSLDVSTLHDLLAEDDANYASQKVSARANFVANVVRQALQYATVRPVEEPVEKPEQAKLDLTSSEAQAMSA